MTTSLQRPPAKPSRSDVKQVESDAAPITNGVPRSAFFRSRRASTWHRSYAVVLVIVDLLCTIAASATAILMWPQADAGFDTTAQVFFVAYILLPLGWWFVLWANGAYDRRYLGIGTDEFKRVIRSSLTVVAVVSFLALTLKADLSRKAVATALLSALAYLVVARYVCRRVLHAIRRTGGCSHRLLLVGTLPESLEVYTAVTRNTYAGLVPVGIYLTEGFAAARGTQTPVPLFARRDLVALVREIGADTVAVCGSTGAEADLRRLAWQLEGTGIDLVVAPQLTDIAGPRVHIRPVEGLPLLHVEEPKLSGVAWLAKNMLDRVVAAIGLLVLAPVFVVTFVLIKATSPGPVYFRQTRVGREGKTFRVWKFRTMFLDAEERLAALVDQNESDGLLFKIRDDPRVTPVGRWLRRLSIDELPQLINVLRGEMSLVGPRPLPAEDGDFLGDVRRRLLVRPGITGLWQVSGRSDLSWDDAVRLDLYYVDNWSLTFDLVILWRTVGVVFQRKGAY